jgi:F5/8 type C domain
MHAPTLDRPGPSRVRPLLAAALAAATVTGVLTVAAGGPAAAAPVCGTADVATNRPAVATSQESVAFPASAAVDGDPGTRWSSAFSDPQSITVDLGTVRSLCEVTLRWETAYGATFRLKTSSTNTDWATTTGTSYTGTGGTQVLPFTGTGRWLRMEGLTRGTPWGYSLWEFGAKAFTEDTGCTGTFPVPTDTPNLGPNVQVFSPTQSLASIQTALDTVFEAQKSTTTAQFQDRRDALLFKPGVYGSAVGTKIRADIGYNTAIMGLGLTPDATTFNGDITVDAFNASDGGNVTQNFWRSAENLAVVPSSPDGDRWAVSQAAPFRRMHIRGNLRLHSSSYGFASGGYIADSKVDGFVESAAQQQWYTRDSTLTGGWRNSVWNMVFSGTRGAPPASFPADNVQPKPAPMTVLPSTPRSREKPFLSVDGADRYQVFVPALRTSTVGESWTATSPGAGTAIPINRFFVTRPSDSAATMNAALCAGYNLLLTPGIYRVTEPIRVTRPDTVVLGIGMATIMPVNGVVPMTVADVDGVKLAGLLFDAGTTNSPALLEVGPTGSAARHAANPTSLHDVFFRIGGSVAGKATTSLVVNSDDVIVDHAWAWRADHGNPGTYGWTVNTADHGVIVNGDHVLATGLFVEHYQKHEVIWNGDDGETIFFQNEKPYDVPDQAGWTFGGNNGYAAYKVADSVTSHRANGLGVYVNFTSDRSVSLFNAIEVPNKPGVAMRNMVTVALGGADTVGSITHVVNGVGDRVVDAGNPGWVRSYP